MGELGYEDGFLATVGSVAAVFNCFGRMLFGYLVDKVSYRCARTGYIEEIDSGGRVITYVVSPT